MASTYENDLRLEEMATGENSGSWGTKTNTNLELIADAFSYGTETIADADTTITIADGAADAARSLALKINSSEDLTTTRTITLAPNTTSKVWIIENNTSGGQTLTISAGSGSNITLLNGQTKIIATDGIGAGSNVVELTQDIAIADLFIDDDLSLQSDGAIINFGADSEIQLTHVADTGLLLTETGGGAPTLQFRDSGLAISSSADGQLDIDSDGTIDINATTSIAFDTDTLYVDSTNNRVGIGTSSPSRSLHISGGTNSMVIERTDATTSALLLVAESNNTAIYSRSSNASTTARDLIFNMGSTEAMRIDSSGQVGIGTSSPDTALEVSTSGSGVTDVLKLTTTSANSVPAILFEADAGSIQHDAARFRVGQTDQNNSSMIFEVQGSGSLAERMRIDSSGNVGIGTTSPAQSLDTTGKIRVRDGGNTTIPSIQMGASGVDGLSLPATNSIAFITNSAERLRIDSSGNVGIGASSPAAKMTIVEDLSGPLDATAFRLNASSANDSNTLFGGPVSSGNYSFFQSYKEGTSAGVRALALNPSGGNVGIGTSSPSSYASTTLEIKGSSTTSDIKMTNTTTGVGNTAGYDLELNGDDINYVNRTSGGNQKFWTNSTERMRIDSSGNLIVGGTSAAGVTSGGIFYATPSSGVYAAANADNAGYFNRNGGDGSIVEFRAGNARVGSIGCRSSGGNLQIDTVQSGIDFGGDGYLPMRNGAITDNSLDIGSSSFRYQDIYATNDAIQTSDRNEKQDIAELSDAEQRVAVAAKGLLRKFRWRDAVTEKGDEARTHFGIIAQDLQAAFAAEGLDAGDYAMFISSTWTDEETGEERTRMGVRYSELLAFIIAAI